MDGSSRPRELIAADRPFFVSKERLDDSQSLSSRSFAHGDLSVGRYRRDRPGLGLGQPNAISAMFMAVVILRPVPGHASWHDGRAIDIPPLGIGALACHDLRRSVISDLSYPFDSFHAFMPQSAFDEMTSELKRPRIERLNCPPTVEHRDDTMLHLAHALNPLLAKPGEATSLFADHVFSAMVAHLAVTYGGLNRGDARPESPGRRGMLTPLQERRATSRILDDLAGDPSLSELALLCGLSRSHFVRAFKQSTGLPPHRWLLMQRVKRAKTLLHDTKRSIADIALECGFADQSHFTRVFSKMLAISPGAWRRQRED